jgi:two-component system, chemotaxis family, sensor kinase Cph1
MSAEDAMGEGPGARSRLRPSGAEAPEREIERLRTRVKVLEQEKAAVESLAAVAAHELLEPLILVESYAELLRERLEGEDLADAREDLAILVTSARRMRVLVETILHDAGAAGRPVKRLPVRLDDVVRDTLALMQHEISGRTATVTVERLPVVHGEEALIGSIYSNLLVNALKFSPREATVIRVGCEEVDGEPELFVESNSPAMPAEERAKIFDAFQRGRHERRARGAGLGLTICRTLVRRHGGRIWVGPSPGGGNRFSFTLPGGPSG